tara:strand:- start:6 stop:371 length:366 start_codon:yes stop_codon:yes gene_type:complete
MNDSYIEFVLNQKNEPIFPDRVDYESVICLGEWPNGTYSAVVSYNSLFEMFREFDAIGDPCALSNIWVALQWGDDWCDTEFSPSFVNWVRQDNETTGDSDHADESEELVDGFPVPGPDKES